MDSLGLAKKVLIILPLSMASLTYGMEKEAEKKLGKAETPIERSYWVVPKTFLAGRYPGERSKKGGAQERINKLLDAGITVFIDLTEPEETHRGFTLVPYEKMLEEEAKKRGLEVRYYKMTIKNHQAPSLQEMEHILDTIDKSFAEGRKVYLHCYEGIARTPTVAACYHIRHGLTPKEALERIGESRGESPSAVPRRPVQKQFIQTYRNSGQETVAVISQPFSQ